MKAMTLTHDMFNTKQFITLFIHVCNCGENNPKKILPSSIARPKHMYRLGCICCSNFN